MAVFLVSGSYGDDDHESSVEVYLDYDGEEELTAAEVQAIFEGYVSTGEFPEDWSVQAVNWAHGAEPPKDEDDARTWKHGGEGDLDRFAAWFRRAPLSVELRGELDEDDDLEGEE